MFDVFRSKMVSYFQEEGVYDLLGITDVKVGKRGVDLAELRGIFGTDVVDKSLKLWNIIISKILYPPIQNLIMACESPQQGWKIVTNIYQEKKESEKTRLEQKWLALEMRESENPQDYMARSEALQLRLASVGTIKDTTHAYKDVVRALPPSFAVQKGILLASDVVTLHALETVVRDAHMEMERERSKEQRREAELALVASGASRSGGGNGGASGGQGVADGQDREIRDGERNRDVFVEDPTGFCRYHQSELHTNGQCRYQQHLRRTRTRAAAEDRHGGGGGGRGGGWSQRGGRPPSGAGRGGGRWAYVVYYAHDDGGYYEDHGDYDDGYYCDDGYHDSGYAHYVEAGTGDSYSYSEGLTISQQTSTDELAAEYGVAGGESVPMSLGVKLSDFDADEEATDFPFRELVGSLMWLSTQTRPDIANAGYADADFASKAADRRSVSGGIVTCGGGVVSWFSRTQKCVTLSTTEAEYVALGDVVKEILFLRQVWRFMLPKVGMPCIPVFEDNQGAIQLAQNPISNSNSKHIDVRHHFLRQLVERKEISVIHVPSPYQRADFLTKSLPKDAFESHRDFVMNLA
ncbi:unnamed protein product [Ectocarpus sp. CCAP 1310/34]|nr:unnamed protein product [Ectocarpus sp. CCAP 1310/34]